MPSAQRNITLDQARYKTLANFPRKLDAMQLQQDQDTIQPRLGPLLSTDQPVRYFYYFETFVQRNVFIPKMASYSHDIQKLSGSVSAQFLRHAVIALGALQASRLGAENRRACKKHEFAALEAYSASLVELRETMTNSPSPPRLLVLWTTLFLGIFELMHDKTGDGWLMHMVHGTASALRAAGPRACKSGLGRSFFHQARVFEASRALLLGEPTFLSEPEWDCLTNDLSERSCLDEMLSIIVQSSKLRARTVKLLDQVNQSHASPVPIDALKIAEEGFRLRQTLTIWRGCNPFPPLQLSALPCSSPPRFGASPEILLTNVFFAAIVIYMSGIFDYEIFYWQRWGIPVPVITEPEVQAHLGSILAFTNVALHETNLSPLLFLFPLRVAAARCSETSHMDSVQFLLRRISRDFAVAGEFLSEVDNIWQQKK
ncbi:hypothetical protein PG999_012822 [Apiospora kogelbergensis]|uniref:Uncharacterized protein n=1 Tax=Apiospora kogelbergensis TaxID=1337665 RepID=A0AAW0QPE3_9PEZI